MISSGGERGWMIKSCSLKLIPTWPPPTSPPSGVCDLECARHMCAPGEWSTSTATLRHLQGKTPQPPSVVNSTPDTTPPAEPLPSHPTLASKRMLAKRDWAAGDEKQVREVIARRAWHIPQTHPYHQLVLGVSEPFLLHPHSLTWIKMPPSAATSGSSHALWYGKQFSEQPAISPWAGKEKMPKGSWGFDMSKASLYHKGIKLSSLSYHLNEQEFQF